MKERIDGQRVVRSERMCGYVDGRMCGYVDGRMCGCVDGRMCGCVDGRMGGWSVGGIKRTNNGVTQTKERSEQNDHTNE